MESEFGSEDCDQSFYVFLFLRSLAMFLYLRRCRKSYSVFMGMEHRGVALGIYGHWRQGAGATNL